MVAAMTAVRMEATAEMVAEMVAVAPAVAMAVVATGEGPGRLATAPSFQRKRSCGPSGCRSARST